MPGLVPALVMSNTKDDLLKTLNMAPETYAMMAKEADQVYRWLTQERYHLKDNCSRKPPYDWSDIRDRSKDEAYIRIAQSGDAHTSYYWNLAEPTEDCPNWIARWFLYHKFRYRDGRNRNPARADEGRSSGSKRERTKEVKRSSHSSSSSRPSTYQETPKSSYYGTAAESSSSYSQQYYQSDQYTTSYYPSTDYPSSDYPATEYQQSSYNSTPRPDADEEEYASPSPSTYYDPVRDSAHSAHSGHSSHAGHSSHSGRRRR
ncbi:hypothetical protein GLAREA_07366 [Glarea lozoyensis ATCC 20868]|uniref:Uncharacterized protein n=1 Tax=Glarea lozoyensis (strain ATCC 20868 / MF5171) TaxID=1116229 RepID=S3E151_GLAL2|nr:uncharacterized protein GLAREA_07366 [Glarea lozoyensis ATCC 20868]EPE32233.1 hypothetical protein GLAREA_07366 [Glarea lozoyensis ATCC 20868]